MQQTVMLKIDLQYTTSGMILLPRSSCRSYTPRLKLNRVWRSKNLRGTEVRLLLYYPNQRSCLLYTDLYTWVCQD